MSGAQARVQPTGHPGSPGPFIGLYGAALRSCGGRRGAA